MTLDSLSREYIALAFGIERHVPGFVDAYFGPETVREEALAGELPVPATLLADAMALAARVAAGDYPEPRKGYLAAQIRAMVATCRTIAGETLRYRDEVRELFDIEPEQTPESVFEEAVVALDELLPGDGSVGERMIAWRKRYEIAPETALRLVDVISDETRRRTAALVALPDGEAVEYTLVQDKPWSGYNWYLGNARSRVELNTDLPIHAHTLTNLICHESYPGHHTEHALKELLLFQERGYGEHAIQLINTPECVISEGIATLAESVIFPHDELASWQAAHVYPAAGIPGDPTREAQIGRAQRTLRGVSANAALLLHDQGVAEDEVVAYIRRYALRGEAEARQSLRFIANPLWRAYTFTYHVGRDLLGRWLSGGDPTARFRALLTEQVYPSLIGQWIVDDLAIGVE